MLGLLCEWRSAPDPSNFLKLLLLVGLVGRVEVLDAQLDMGERRRPDVVAAEAAELHPVERALA